jgi:predicted glycogen debranching enzyme
MGQLFEKEWLVTNGLGSYASGTVCGANTRRYHGLLVASLNPPTDRWGMVSKIEERVFINDTYHDVSSNQYSDMVYPSGKQYLNDFNHISFPIWNYGMHHWKLEKSICMVQGSNTTLISYTNTGTTPFYLELHPLYENSDFHDTFRESQYYDFYTEISKNHIKTYPCYGSKPIFTGWSSGEFTEARSWYKNINLPIEQERGYDFVCDYYRIGYVKHNLKPDEQLVLCFTLEEEVLLKGLKQLYFEEKKKLAKTSTREAKGFYGDLLNSGNQFLVKRKSTDSMSIIAGYHWFEDWGRDTMISMRGLTIATGNKYASKSILATFFKSIDHGMIPNHFPEHGRDVIPYDTMDATLWLFVATYEYVIQFNDLSFARKYINKLKRILDYHISGTRYDIHVTEEGFLFGGKEGQKLTWMDAVYNGHVVTPRIGCPVEVNALWYNALKIYEVFCQRLKLGFEPEYAQICTKFEANFPKMFINQQGTLYDVIIPNKTNDNCFRPNQLFCLSLPFSVLGRGQQKKIFQAVRKKLYTPYGLRTLDKDNPAFQGEYKGNQSQRDEAYHQGTVWPYLLYAYYHAFFKLYGDTLKNKKSVVKELIPLKEHFYNHQGLYCISEVFDGDEPKQGKGCIQQAWSVAALIQLYARYELYELDN